MDTDFRMFSAAHLGRLPGIDLATVLDGAAYHTSADIPERLRAGTLQACCLTDSNSLCPRFAWIGQCTAHNKACQGGWMSKKANKWVFLQLRGENLVATLRAFSEDLAAQARPGGAVPAHDAEGSVYFDVLSAIMVSLALTCCLPRVCCVW